MMNDIVARIRNRINDAPMPTERLLDEAADEIDRLRLTLQHISRMAIANIKQPIPADDDAE